VLPRRRAKQKTSWRASARTCYLLGEGAGRYWYFTLKYRLTAAVWADTKNLYSRAKDVMRYGLRELLE
jgi:hypothetical protein